MKQFTIEVDETVCKWLEYIAEITGETVEGIISNCIFNNVVILDDNVAKVYILILAFILITTSVF